MGGASDSSHVPAPGHIIRCIHFIDSCASGRHHVSPDVEHPSCTSPFCVAFSQARQSSGACAISEGLDLEAVWINLFGLP